MSEREELAAELREMRSGVALDAIISKVAARRVTESDWLRAHDDRIRAEERERLGVLTDDELDAAAALRVAAGTPTHHTTEEDTP